MSTTTPPSVPKPPPRRHRPAWQLWLPAGGLAAALLVGFALFSWQFLPRWAPDWVLSNSPWLDPVVRALGDHLCEFDAEAPHEWEFVGEEAFYETFERRLADEDWSSAPERLSPLLVSSRARTRRAAALLLAMAAKEAEGPQLSLATGIALGSEDPVLRVIGVRIVGTLRPPPLGLVANSLEDPDPRVRRAALRVVRWSARAPGAADVLLAGLRSPYPQVREAVLQISRSARVLGCAQQEGLRSLLGDPDPRLRSLIVSSLGTCVRGCGGHGEAALRSLLVARIDAAAEVREATTDVVLAGVNEEWVGKALGHERRAVRQGAQLVLADLGRLIQPASFMETIGDLDPEVRSAALLTWCEASEGRDEGSLDVTPFLPLIADPQFEVRLALTAVFERVEGDAASRGLAALAGDSDPRVRRAAMAPLAGKGDYASGRSALARAFFDPDPEARERAIRAAAEASRAELVWPLVGAMPRCDEDQLRLACMALGGLGRLEVLPVLSACLRHQEPEVRRAAERALVEVRRRNS